MFVLYRTNKSVINISIRRKYKHFILSRILQVNYCYYCSCHILYQTTLQHVVPRQRKMKAWGNVITGRTWCFNSRHIVYFENCVYILVFVDIFWVLQIFTLHACFSLYVEFTINSYFCLHIIYLYYNKTEKNAVCVLNIFATKICRKLKK